MIEAFHAVTIPALILLHAHEAVNQDENGGHADGHDGDDPASVVYWCFFGKEDEWADEVS
jgi:hypothetical protein